MQECIEHRLPIAGICIDQRCNFQFQVCDGCTVRGSHQGHQVVPLRRLISDIHQFDRERKQQNETMQRIAVENCQQKLQQIRYSVDSLLCELEKTLEGRVLSLEVEVKQEVEEVVETILKGELPTTGHRYGLKEFYARLHNNKQSTKELCGLFEGQLDRTAAEIVECFRRIIGECMTKFNSYKSWFCPIRDRGAEKPKFANRQFKARSDKFRRSTSEKFKQLMCDSFNPARQPSRGSSNPFQQSPSKKSRKYSIFRPVSLLSSDIQKSKSTSVVHHPRTNSREKDLDLTMKIQANREAMSNGQSSVLNMIEEKQRRRREQQSLFNEDRLKKIIQQEVQQVLLKEIRHTVQGECTTAKNSKRMKEQKILPQEFQQQNIQEPLPLESVLRQITEGRLNQPRNPVQSPEHQKITDVRQTGQKDKPLSPSDPRLDAVEELPTNQQLLKTRQNMTQPSSTAAKRQSATLNHNPAKKVLKKARQCVNKTIEEIDENFELPTVALVQPSHLPETPQTHPPLPEPERISTEELKERLALIPKLHFFLDDNLKQMEQAWQEGNFMCWSRYFQLRLENGLDNGDYLPLRKRCKKTVFNFSKLLGELQQNFTRVKITSVKKRKNLLVMQYMVLHLIVLIVLVEGRTQLCTSIFNQQQNQQVLQHLERDELPAVHSFTSTKLSQLKLRQLDV